MLGEKRLCRSDEDAAESFFGGWGVQLIIIIIIYIIIYIISMKAQSIDSRFFFLESRIKNQESRIIDSSDSRIDSRIFTFWGH